MSRHCRPQPRPLQTHNGPWLVGRAKVLQRGPEAIGQESWGIAALDKPFPTQIDLYAGALFVHICLGWNFYLSTVLMLVITALYTITGTGSSGLWTEWQSWWGSDH